MRYPALALAVVLLVGLGAGAQQPQQPSAAAPMLDPARNRLDALLLQWQQSMQQLQVLEADCTRTTMNKAFNSTEVMQGKAQYMRPNLAALHLRKPGPGNADVFERFICSGTFLYEFVPAQKVVRVHDLPKPKEGQVADDNFLSFIFGMKAE